MFVSASIFSLRAFEHGPIHKLHEAESVSFFKPCFVAGTDHDCHDRQLEAQLRHGESRTEHRVGKHDLLREIRRSDTMEQIFYALHFTTSFPCAD